MYGALLCASVRQECGQREPVDGGNEGEGEHHIDTVVELERIGARLDTRRNCHAQHHWQVSNTQ